MKVTVHIPIEEVWPSIQNYVNLRLQNLFKDKFEIESTIFDTNYDIELINVVVNLIDEKEKKGN